MVWFGKVGKTQYLKTVIDDSYVLQVPSTPLRICKQPARKGNDISIRADGVRPLTYEWLLGGIKLCDGDDHNCDGYVTDSLVIKDSDLLSEGLFKCQVKDRFGNCVESDELGKHYNKFMHMAAIVIPVLTDLFEDQLRRTWKLNKSEINKLKSEYISINFMILFQFLL